MSDFEVNLPVPYKSEWDQDATETANDCGPTSAAMVMGYYGENHTTNEIFEKTNAGQGLITISQLMVAIQKLDFRCEYKEGMSEDDLKNFLRQGIVPIVLVHYGSLNSRQDTNFKGGHFFALVGFRNDGWLVNDPNFWGNLRQDGDHHFYTEAEFMAAWGNCHIDDNPDFAAIIIYPKTPVINYESLYNAKREECDDNWNIAAAAINTLRLPIPPHPTHEDKIEMENNVEATIKAILTARDGYKNKLEEFEKEGYNNLDDIKKAIEAAKNSVQPVVNVSTPTVSVPITYPGMNKPTTQPNPPSGEQNQTISISIGQLILNVFKKLKKGVR